MFANQNEGKWQCTSCLAYSPDASSSCDACETPKPNSSSGTGFTFETTTKTSGSTGFTFDTTPQEVQPASQFTFGTGDQISSSNFTFTTNSNPAPAAFSFGNAQSKPQTMEPETPQKRESPAKIASFDTPVFPLGNGGTGGGTEQAYEEPAEDVPPPPTIAPSQPLKKRSREEAGLPQQETWHVFSKTLFDSPIPRGADSQPQRNAAAIEGLKRQLLEMQRQLREKDTRIGTLTGRVQELEHDIENRVWTIREGEILVSRPTKRRRINVEGGKPGIPESSTPQQKLWNSYDKWHGSAKRQRVESQLARTISAPADVVTGRPTLIPCSSVLTCGLGEQGELGRGDDDPENDMMSKQFIPLNLPFDTTSPNTKILSLASGTMASAILADVDGKRALVTWGGEDCGLGRGYNPEPDEFHPADVPLPEGCVPAEVAVGNTMLTVCSESGELYMSGGFTNSNNKKCFGMEKKTKKYNLTRVPTPKPVDHIAAGQEFVVASAGRDVYIIGYDPTYQFPEQDKMMQDPNTGQMIKMPENIQIVQTEERCYIGKVEEPRFRVPFDIKKIVASQETMALISTDGRLYMCGMNDHGQCGSPELPWDEVIQEPTHVDSGVLRGRKVVDARTGQYTIALTSDGDVITFGRNTDGQLGTGEDVSLAKRPPSNHTPQLVKLPAHSKARGIGRGLLAAFAIGPGGELYAWGCNTIADECSALGLKDIVAGHVTVPMQVPGVAASIIAAGDKHAVLVGVSDSDDLIARATKRARVAPAAEHNPPPAPEPAPASGNLLAQMFANQTTGKWQCATCLAYSGDSSTQCDACETPKPGAAPVNNSGFSFTFQTTT